MAELTGTLVSHIASFEGNLGKEATWGLINGDISDQEDLQSALNLKAESSDLTDHINDTNNPHEVTKAQLGLGNVDNTSDINKPISSATQVALNGKVSDVKVNGQSVVTDMVANVVVPTLTSDLTNDSGFIDKDVNNLTNYTLSSNLSEVATSGDYEDLNNKPSIPTKTSDLTNDSGFVDKDVNDLTYYRTSSAQDTIDNTKANVSDLATVATSGSYNDLSNKPSIPTVNNATLTIQKNGSTVETFTANSSSNKTANITVPTKTSDLTNDSGFISSTSWGGIGGTLSNQTDLKNALDSKANDNDIVHLTGSELISGNKTFGAGATFQDPIIVETKSIDADGVLYENDAQLLFPTLDAEATETIATLSDIPTIPVSDVQVNGTSVVSSGVANIPVASSNGLGVVSGNTYYGFNIDQRDGSKGNVTCGYFQYTTYQNASNAIFISKGTLENVITGKGLATTSQIPTAISQLQNDTGYLTGVSWGDLEGILSDQTDLQNALDLKANDSNVVHKTGSEAIKGNKRFDDVVYFGTSSVGGYYKFDKNGLTHTKSGSAKLVSYPTPTTNDKFALVSELPTDNDFYVNKATANLENEYIYCTNSQYGDAPRLMKYNNTKIYAFLGDRYRIIENGVMPTTSRTYARSANESDSANGITISPSIILPGDVNGGVRSAFGILSPNNDGRIIVFYGCLGQKTITLNDHEYTLPYYSLRAKVSDTSGIFDDTTRGTILLDNFTGATLTETSQGNITATYSEEKYRGGIISMWEPFAIKFADDGGNRIAVYYSHGRNSDDEMSYQIFKDGEYYVDPSIKCQDIRLLRYSVHGTTLTQYDNNDPTMIINGPAQTNLEGGTYAKTKAGMTSLVRFSTDGTVDEYLGVNESNVNQSLSTNKINLNVQIYHMDREDGANLVWKNILLPNPGQSRGAPYIARLDDGRIVITFMSSQEYRGNKTSENSVNSRVIKMYVSKIPISDISQITDEMFTEVKFFDFGLNQWGKWGSIANIDGTLYKAFTFGCNPTTDAQDTVKYGQIIIKNV